MRNFNKNNQTIITNALDKFHKGDLEVNDILESDELTNDAKSSMSQLAGFFNESKNIKSLLDFIIKEPLEDDQKKGHKFPFFACEILCSDNPNLLKNIFDENKNNEEEEYEDDDNKENEKKKNDDDEIDIDLEENFASKSLEEQVLNKEGDIVENNEKFKIGEDEDNDYKENKDDLFELNNMEENTINRKNLEDDDLVNIEMENNEEIEKKEDSEIEHIKESIRYDDGEKKEEEDEDDETNKENEDTKEQTDSKDYSEDKTPIEIDSDDQTPLVLNDEKEEIEIETETETEIENNDNDNEEEIETIDEKTDVIIDEYEIKNEEVEVEEETVKIKICDDEDQEVKESEEDSINNEENNKEQEEEIFEKQDVGEEHDHDQDEEIEENIVVENKDDEDNEGKEDNEQLSNEKKERKDSLNISTDKFDTDLLDYFFNFLDTDESLNFVLSGYFAKVFGHFLNQRQSIVMKYILVTKPDVMRLFTKHINRKSIVECIYKILISYSDDIPNSVETKIKFIKMIIEAFNADDDEVVTNTCDLILDMFSVRKMYILFITNKSIFEMIFDFVLQNINNNSFKYLIKILIKANENILKDFGTTIVTPTFTCNETQELFFNFTYNVNNLISGNSSYNNGTEGEEINLNIQNLNQQFQLIFTTLTTATEVILKNFVDEDNQKSHENDTTFGIKVRCLGTKRLLEIEYIRSILEILINAYAHNMFAETLDLSLILNKIIESNFLKSALVSFLNFIN